MPPSPRLLSILAASFLAAVTCVAHADTFQVTGPSYDLTFFVPSSPTPSFYNADRFQVDHVTYFLNGSSALKSDFIFYNTGGGESYTFFVGTSDFGAGGTTPFFTGTTAMPTFLTGTYTIFGGGLYGKPGSGPLQLTITPDPSSVPEPSTLALLGTGMLGLASVARRRLLAR